MLDRWSLGLADLVLCDTWAHGELYASLGARRERLRRVLVGAEDEFFAVPAAAPRPVVRIGYVGGFLPLHGVHVVLEAAAILERRTEPLPAWEIVLAGRGIEHDAAREQARSLGLASVQFPGPLDYATLPAWLAEAAVVLGAFGRGEKAGRVIPHKVYQGLAAGRAVVTGDGPGVREVFEAETHLATVPRGDAGALAAALAELIASPARRDALGRAGRARALEVATPERIAASLIEALAGTR